MKAEATRNRHILVTGIHRSGTTFVGEMLSSAPNTGYVQEPFNPDLGIEGIDIWYPYVRNGIVQEKYYSDLVNLIISGHAKYKNRSRFGGGFFRTIGKKMFGSRDYLRYLASTRLPGSRRLILKDPLASLSSEWLHRKFGMDVLILLRHPAGFVDSTMRLGWDFDFSNLTAQTPLMEDYLREILASFDTTSMQPWQRGALLWQCIYSVLDVFANRNPGIKIIRLEDLSLNPEEKFLEIHEFTALPFTKKSLRTIRKSTASSNPVKAPGGQVHFLRRNSSKSVDVWRKSLDETTIAGIRKLAGPPAEKYYGKDW
ncbi:MAG: sulfotransferase domain-containing protein [Candidatus Sabulitectum sp.]|nr:sulfotransferase domain-containing protein [Candidatus Sabulitectum sp.]